MQVGALRRRPVHDAPTRRGAARGLAARRSPTINPVTHVLDGVRQGFVGAVTWARHLARARVDPRPARGLGALAARGLGRCALVRRRRRPTPRTLRRTTPLRRVPRCRRPRGGCQYLRSARSGVVVLRPPAARRGRHRRVRAGRNERLAARAARCCAPAFERLARAGPTRTGVAPGALLQHRGIQLLAVLAGGGAGEVVGRRVAAGPRRRPEAHAGRPGSPRSRRAP